MNSIIVMFKNKDKELNMSLYDFIDEQYRKANPFIVCHVSEEDYQTMLKQIKSGLLNERLPIISTNDIGYNKFAYLLAYDKINNNISVCDYDHLEKRGNYVIDDKGIHFNEVGYQFPNDPAITRFFSSELKIYTTERYKDVVEHYQKKKSEKKISLSCEDIKRYEKAYDSLSKSVDPEDFTEEDLTEFRVLFAKIISKCDS